MPKSTAEYLRHIRDETDYIITALDGLSKEQFLAHETLKRAVVRSFEIIGEAVRKIPQTFRDQHPDVPWRAIAGMRDRLIHGYLEVDYDVVWEAASSKIAELRIQVLRMLNESPDSS